MEVKKGRWLIVSCCAPCSCGTIKYLKDKGVDFSVLFYNPNIRPKAEYDRRCAENKRVCEKYGVPFIELAYDNDRWCALTAGLEAEPERGRRCDVCFKMRLERALAYAAQNHFDFVSSVLGVSRYKDFDQVCRAAAAVDPKGIYQPVNWRKDGIEVLRQNLCRELDLYRQDYCGCRPRR